MQQWRVEHSTLNSLTWTSAHHIGKPKYSGTSKSVALNSATSNRSISI